MYINIVKKKKKKKKYLKLFKVHIINKYKK